MKRKTENNLYSGLISIKELAKLIDSVNWQAAYNNLRQKVVRGKFKSYQLIDGRGFVSLDDALVPDFVKQKFSKTTSASNTIGSLDNTKSRVIKGTLRRSTGFCFSSC